MTNHQSRCMLDSSLHNRATHQNCMAAKLHCRGEESVRGRNAGRGQACWIPKCKLARASKQNFGVFQIILSTPLNSFSSFFFFLAETASSPVGRVSQLEILPLCCQTSSDQNLGLIWDFSWTSRLGWWRVYQGPLSAGRSRVASLPVVFQQ